MHPIRVGEADVSQRVVRVGLNGAFEVLNARLDAWLRHSEQMEAPLQIQLVGDGVLRAMLSDHGAWSRQIRPHGIQHGTRELVLHLEMSRMSISRSYRADHT